MANGLLKESGAQHPASAQCFECGVCGSLTFNGERIDPVLGGYHLGNGYRLYSPGLRRFTSPDSMSPFGKGRINPYAYCEGDPINNTDPTGHSGIFGAIINVGMFAADLLTDGAASAAEEAGVLAKEGESIAGRKAKQVGRKATLKVEHDEVRPSIARNSLRVPLDERRFSWDRNFASQKKELKFQPYESHGSLESIPNVTLERHTDKILLAREQQHDIATANQSNTILDQLYNEYLRDEDAGDLDHGVFGRNDFKRNVIKRTKHGEHTQAYKLRLQVIKRSLLKPK